MTRIPLAPHRGGRMKAAMYGLYLSAQTIVLFLCEVFYQQAYRMAAAAYRPREVTPALLLYGTMGIFLAMDRVFADRCEPRRVVLMRLLFLVALGFACSLWLFPNALWPDKLPSVKTHQQAVVLFSIFLGYYASDTVKRFLQAKRRIP